MRRCLDYRLTMRIGFADVGRIIVVAVKTAPRPLSQRLVAHWVRLQHLSSRTLPLRHFEISPSLSTSYLLMNVRPLKGHCQMPAQPLAIRGPRSPFARFRTKSLSELNLCHCCLRRKPLCTCFFSSDAEFREAYKILSVSNRGMSHSHRDHSASGDVCGRARLVSGRMLPYEGLCTC